MQNVTIDESQKIIDSTKLSAFMRCPRRYFYEYVLGWRSETPSHDLYFGEAVHKSLAVIEERGYSAESAALAYNEFETYYRKEFPPETDELYDGKVPNNFFEFLADYCGQQKEESVNLYTEITGSVPVSLTEQEERRIYFRIDSIRKNERTGKIFAREHKTTGLYLSEVWQAEHELSIQIGAYNHVLYCMFDESEVGGVEVNGISFRKNKHEWRRFTVYKSYDSMGAWLFTVNDIIDQIEFELERLKEQTADSSVMTCFPMRPTSCTAFFKICPYQAFCLAWSNPLSRANQPPPGFTVEFWDPRKVEGKFNFTLKGKE